MKFLAKTISPLEKVFYNDDPARFPEYPSSSALMGEKHNLCVLYRDDDYANGPYCVESCFVRLSGTASENAAIYSIEHVPSVFAAPSFENPDRYLRREPGLFPDVLAPLKEGAELPLVPRITSSLWITVDTGSLSAGDHTLTVEFLDSNGSQLAVCHHTLHVVNARLPEQTLMVTHWMHTDCLADYYGIKVFSPAYWKALKNFITVYVELGNNMIYTPLFTPPLDTAVGGERTTVQLVDVEKDGDKFRFGFEKLRRFIHLAKDCGITYFEMSHLFTQWGAFHTPKIMAKINRRTKKLFGWETSSHSPEYEAFLAAFLPQLRQLLTEEGIAERTFFHISDEPQKEHLESYTACSRILRKYLPDFPIMDAMGDVEFYDRGLVDIPVPFIAHAKSFFQRNPHPNFVYYCGASRDFMGRALGMPSCRNRISGALFYEYGVEGFLHWGFNFYNTAKSTAHIDPFFVTDAGRRFCAGDSYLVYPGKDLKPLLSIRALVFRDGLQDMRALRLCETLCGRETVEGILTRLNDGKPLDILSVPQDDYYTQKLREEINKAIETAQER